MLCLVKLIARFVNSLMRVEMFILFVTTWMDGCRIQRDNGNLAMLTRLFTIVILSQYMRCVCCGLKAGQDYCLCHDNVQKKSESIKT